jgi:hypothetical protein
LEKEVVVMVKAVGLIVRLSCCVAESGPDCPPDESVTFTVKVEVAGVVGVPDSTPPLDKLSHEGSDEPVARLQVSVPAPPLACKVAL